MLVLIGGASGSGKTELSNALRRRLQEAGIPTTLVIMDHYYKPRSPETHPDPKAYFAETDFDVPESMDLERLVRDLRDLEELKDVTRPTYSFLTFFNETPVPTRALARVVLVEGMFALNLMPELSPHQPLGVYVDADYETILDRRIARDITGCRGKRTEAEIRALDAEKVRPAFEQHVAPSKQHATYIICNESNGRLGEHVDSLMKEVLTELGARESTPTNTHRP